MPEVHPMLSKQMKLMVQTERRKCGVGDLHSLPERAILLVGQAECPRLAGGIKKQKTAYFEGMFPFLEWHSPRRASLVGKKDPQAWEYSP
jgi:hypothetical protein